MSVAKARTQILALTITVIVIFAVVGAGFAIQNATINFRTTTATPTTTGFSSTSQSLTGTSSTSAASTNSYPNMQITITVGPVVGQGTPSYGFDYVKVCIQNGPTSGALAYTNAAIWELGSSWYAVGGSELAGGLVQGLTGFCNVFGRQINVASPTGQFIPELLLFAGSPIDFSNPIWTYQLPTLPGPFYYQLSIPPLNSNVPPRQTIVATAFNPHNPFIIQLSSDPALAGAERQGVMAWWTNSTVYSTQHGGPSLFSFFTPIFTMDGVNATVSPNVIFQLSTTACSGVASGCMTWGSPDQDLWTVQAIIYIDPTSYETAAGGFNVHPPNGDYSISHLSTAEFGHVLGIWDVWRYGSIYQSYYTRDILSTGDCVTNHDMYGALQFEQAIYGNGGNVPIGVVSMPNGIDANSCLINYYSPSSNW